MFITLLFIVTRCVRTRVMTLLDVFLCYYPVSGLSEECETNIFPSAPLTESLHVAAHLSPVICAGVCMFACDESPDKMGGGACNRRLHLRRHH